VPTVAYARFVGSAANVLFSAADATYASADSKFLLHPVSINVNEGDTKFFRVDQIDIICQDATSQLIHTLATDTGMPKEFIATLMSDEVVLTSEQALEIGLIEKIVCSPIPTIFDDRVVIRDNYAVIARGDKVYYKGGRQIKL